MKTNAMTQNAPDAAARIRRYALLTGLVWTLLIGGSLAWNIAYIHRKTESSAQIEAIASLNKDIAFRNWAASYGGVYVPPNDRTPPNPYLADIPERDVSTTSGTSLTLINPAYMLRLVQTQFTELYGAKTRITSLKPLNPVNAPDAWERDALLALERNLPSVSGRATINGKPYLRAMAPLKTAPGCLRCHARQGYKVGEVRGGIDVAVPMDSYHAKANEEAAMFSATYLLLWLFGGGAIGLIARHLEQRAREREQTEQALQQARQDWKEIFQAIGHPVFISDPQHRIVAANRAALRVTGLTEEAMRAATCCKLLCHFAVCPNQQAANQRFEMETSALNGVYLLTCTPTFSAQGELQNIIHVATDMTARKRAEDELEKHREQLEELVEERTMELRAEIDSRTKTEQWLRESEIKYRTLFESVPVGIGIADFEGHILENNSALQALYGYSKEEMAFLNIRTTYADPDERPRLLRMLQQRGNGKMYGREVRLKRKNGEVFEALINIEQVQLVGREFLLTTVRDITVLKRAEETLRRAKDAADAANQAKSEFLANMSHEMRTPLNGILGYTQLLIKDRELPARVAHSVETIHRSGEHLLELINDILDLAKIEARKIELASAPFDLPAAAQMVVSMVRMRAAQKNLVVREEYASGLPRIVRGDETRLRQVLFNLLGNAIKFTERGEVTLRVERRLTPFGQAAIRFEVEDTGIGIPADQIDKIFEPFYQAGAEKMKSQGTGLGLTISKQIVRLMRGDIFVTSAAGRGSRFWFDLPLPAAAAAAAPARPSEIIGYTGAPRHLLIVDDDPVNRMLLKDMLAPLGFNISEAENGQDALTQAAQSRPDLALMDIVMPEMGGIEAISRMKQTPELRQTIIVAFSANVMEDIQQQVRAAGGDDFLAKPIQFETLLEKLAALLGVSWRYLPPSALPPEHSNAPSPVICPPESELQKLIEAAQIGDIIEIRGIVDALEASNQAYAPFASAIRQHAKQFDIAKILQFVQEHVERLHAQNS